MDDNQHSSEMNHNEEHQNSYTEYNFKNPEHGQNDMNQLYQPAPKKEHPVLKNIGVFAVKAVIASVIGGLALGTTLVSVNKITGFDQVIEQLSKEDEEDAFSGFQFPGFGNGSSGESPSGGSGDQGNGQSGSDNQQAGNTETSGPKLGISVTTVTDDMIEQGYPAGVLIAAVTEGGDADSAGLKEGDIITAFDGTVVNSNAELVQLVQSSDIGKSAKVVYKRLENGEYKAMETTVTFTDGSESDGTESENDSSADSSTNE